ncbi:3-phosphoshikimate 1-carboxyvinyltransferase [Croceicoccus esteveae]
MPGATQPRRFCRSGPLHGRILVPGDKSISHRAIMLASLAVGTSTITGLLESADVTATAAAMRATGASIEQVKPGVWRIDGVGVGSLLQPAAALDMGNSGTSTRLLMGLFASHGIQTVFTGDASLSRRPMGRVIQPLALMGAQFTVNADDTLPLTMRGADPAVPIHYRLQVASAQVKSAILLAALNTAGSTIVVEPTPTRDHTERMLRGFGANLSIDIGDDGARIITMQGPQDLHPCDIEVPGDPSSAAFFVVAALLVPGSDLTIANVGMNPTRAALLDVLRAMGGSIEEEDHRVIGGEPVADLRVRHSELKGIEIDPASTAAMIDEFPILFVAAALASGRTVTQGLEELRVKESDRLAVMSAALTFAGASVEEHADGLTIEGTGGAMLRGTLPGQSIATMLDHRIAMSMAIAGLVSEAGVTVDDMRPVATSFPQFERLLGDVQCR